MALSKLSGDEAGILFGRLCSALDPRYAVDFSSASLELWKLTQALRQQLRTDYEAVSALCSSAELQGAPFPRSCKELREARDIYKDLSADDMALLGTLGSVLPALKSLTLYGNSAGPDGALRLVEGLGAGALSGLTKLDLTLHVGDTGASALSAALGRGAMPRLKFLDLTNAGIGGAGLVALAPALRQRPALEYLSLRLNPLSDEGIAALVTPPPPPDALPPSTGGLAKLQALDLVGTNIADAGGAALIAALDSGVLPALKELLLYHAPASAAAKRAVATALKESHDPRKLLERGNHAYKQRNFDQAIHFFTLVIAMYPDNTAPAQLFSNRAAALCGKKRYNDALADADRAIRQQPQWGKGHSRRATALHALRRLDEARAAYEKALELDPHNQYVRTSLESLLKLSYFRPHFRPFSARRGATA